MKSEKAKQELEDGSWKVEVGDEGEDVDLPYYAVRVDVAQYAVELAEQEAEERMRQKAANGLSREELRLNYNAACNAYLAAFCEKHGYDYEPDAWVGDDPGGIAEVGDLFVSMADMLTDIDRDAPEEEYIKYYDYCMRVGAIANGELETPNYDSWLRGCPRIDEEQIARLEELQRDVCCAEMNLKVEIDRLNNIKQG